MSNYTRQSNKSETSKAKYQDSYALLEKAKKASNQERISILQELAYSLKGADPLTEEYFAQELRLNDLCTKTVFRAAIQDFKHPEERKTPPTDDELRDRWLERHPLTAYGLGDFRRYTHGYWEALELMTVVQEMLKILEKAKEEWINPTSSRLTSVRELARAHCFIPTDQWDANPDILVCLNGTLHIPSRSIRDHDPNDYATSRLPYDYDPNAKAPTWESILKRLEIAIPGVTSFLQEFAGYSLTTETKHELALWLYGPPGSGKSTLIYGLETLLGSRSGVLGISDVGYRFGLSNLIGKTLVVSTEQPGDSRVAIHVLNAIISGEKLNIDIKFKDAIEYIPFAKVMWSMNELPYGIDPRSGIWRRVIVIEFPPLEERDVNMKELISVEGPGILNWALDGLERLRNRGRFDIPKILHEATMEFRRESGLPDLFVSECCSIGPHHKTQSIVLYEAYKLWCIENGHQPQSQQAIASAWKRLGFRRHRINGRSYWYGVGLIE